jgi:hypothetical protein
LLIFFKGTHTPPIFESQDPYESQSVDEIPWSSPTPARPQLFFDRLSDIRSRTSSPTAVVRETPQNNHSRRSFTPKAKPTPAKPKPKPTHMDSQIDFVAIEGTPDLETQDSQLITEHQKEVREEQAQAAGLFPELTASVARKPRRTMKLGSVSPSAARRQEAHGVASTPTRKLNDGLSAMVPETTIKKDTTKAPEPVVSFISESHIDSNTGSVLGSQASSVADEKGGDNVKSRVLGEGSSELIDLDSDNDITISNYPEASQITPTRRLLFPPDIPSDEPSGDDNFVDAPDHFNNDSDERTLPCTQNKNPNSDTTSPPRDAPEIVIEISPAKDASKYEATEASESPAGPDAQIVSEILTAAGSPPPKVGKRRGRKRKRVTTMPQQENKVNASPEVLDTIVIAETEKSPISMCPVFNKSPEPERPAKKARALDAEDTPVKTRTSARSNKGKKLGLRGSAGKLVSDGGLDGMSGKTPAFVHYASY